MNQQKQNLTPIFSYSIPANHLLQISLVKQSVPSDSYKKQHFFFITLAPGSQAPDGTRTFNFQNRITLKQEIHQIFALANALRDAAHDRERITGKYTSFVDASKSAFGGNENKSIMVARSTDKQGNIAVVIYFKVGHGQAIGFGMNPHIAIALAEVCWKLAKIGLNLEFSRGQSSEFGVSPNPAFGDAQIGTPPMTPNAPGNVVNNFANTFENMFPDDSPPF